MQQEQQLQDSSQRPDLSPRLQQDWLPHPVLRADLQLALGRAVAAVLAVVAVVLVPDL